MALQVIRNDLARVAADAIVIPANPSVKIGGGTENSIYMAAGKEKLLAARQKIGELQPGEVAATEAFNLQAFLSLRLRISRTRLEMPYLSAEILIRLPQSRVVSSKLFSESPKSSLTRLAKKFRTKCSK